MPSSPQLQRQIATLFAPHADVSPAHAESLIETMDEINIDVSNLSQLVRDQAHVEFQELSNQFRLQLLVLTIVSILAINLSILALLRMGGMILRPVDKLVAAARELGKEKFDVRIQLETNDEFGQLAQAYNHMAEELEAAERRRMDVLGQVALTMNHELNNVINIIELQLVLVSKRTEGSGALEGHLKQIRESLGRMTKVVDELRHARRIVLTDYTAGMKMIDLHRSAEASDAAEETDSGPIRDRVPSMTKQAERQYPLALELAWFIRLRWIAGSSVAVSGAIDGFRLRLAFHIGPGAYPGVDHPAL